MITELDLGNMGFTKGGILTTTANGQFKYDAQGTLKNKTPGIYLWLHRKDAMRFDVMYAGKAGNGIVIRMGEHIGGLKAAPAQRIDRVRESFGLGNCLEIWFRQSAKITMNALFDGEISAYSTEEEAAISRFAPRLNRAKTPSMRAAASEVVKENAQNKKDSKKTKKATSSAVAQEGVQITKQEQVLLPIRAQQANALFDALSYELISANGVQRDLWDNALVGLTVSHKQKIGQVLGLLSHSAPLRDQWPDLDCKVVGLYTAGPIRNQSMLVFGKLAKTIFKTGSQVVRISLEKELISFSPDITANMPAPPDVDGAYTLDTCIRMLGEG